MSECDADHDSNPREGLRRHPS